MISDFSAFGWKFLLSSWLFGLPTISLALCEELSRVGTGDDGTFFVSCKSTFAKPQYLITEYYAEGNETALYPFGMAVTVLCVRQG